MSFNNLDNLDEKIRFLEQKKKALGYKLANGDRKERTRRLIQKGALLEKYFNIEELNIEKTEMLLSVMADFKNKNAEYFQNRIRQMSNNRINE